MIDRHGQTIGGIKSQQKIVRESLAKLEARIEDDIARYDATIACIRSEYATLLSLVKTLEFKVIVLRWSLWCFYGTLVIVYLLRVYG